MVTAAVQAAAANGDGVKANGGEAAYDGAAQADNAAATDGDQVVAPRAGR